MKKIYFIFPIYFLACTLSSSAQITITNELKQQLAVLDNRAAKTTGEDPATINANYFKQRISLLTNNSFKLSLVANMIDAEDVGANTQSTDQKEVVKAAVETKKFTRDAKYFRQHISLINGDSYQFNLVGNKAEKAVKLVDATHLAISSIPATEGTATAPVEIAKVVVEDKKFARDAKFFRQHISLINGTDFQFNLEPNKAIKTIRVKKAVDVYAKYAYTVGIIDKPVLIEMPKQPIYSATDEELQAELAQRINTNMVALKSQFDAVVADSLRAFIPQKMPANITTLKQQVALVLNDTLRANLYQTIATHYLVYDSISILQTKQFFQESALDFTMKGLHTFSKYGDQTGLRESYSRLAKVYKDQKKFSEAKWFVLQANFIARQQKDTKNVITTLIDLASVKTAIKDYKLALGDLDEALLLSTQNHLTRQESLVQANYAVVYTELDDAAKSELALKRHNALEKSIRKAEIARLTPPVVKVKDSTGTTVVAANPKAKKKASATIKKGTRDSTSTTAISEINIPSLKKSNTDSTTIAATSKAKKKASVTTKKGKRDTTNAIAISEIQIPALEKVVFDSVASASQTKRKPLTADSKKAAKTPPAKKAVVL